jgi:transcription termination/antitermination protein NusG
VAEPNIADRSIGNCSWYAVQTLSRHEKLVRGQLQKQNVEHFLPTIKRLNQWTDRKKEVEVPLFPGYCFAKLAWEDRLAVLQSQGVVRLVGGMGRPEPIPAHEIDSLRMLVKNYRSKLMPHSYLQEGMHVEVTNGPLRGVKGRLVREARYARLVVSVSLIQRSVAVEIDVDSVVPAQYDTGLYDAGLCKVF